jgi:hypothetical protein
MYKNLSHDERSFYETEALKDRQRYYKEAQQNTILKVKKT